MKNTKKLLLVCSLFSLLASCVNDPEVHQLVPIESPFVLYADQMEDSLRFYTLDSWTVTPQVDWIMVDGDSHKEIKYNYTKRYLFKVMLLFKPNTTGRARKGTVLVQSYDYSYYAPFVQLGLLQVSHPALTVESFLDEQETIPDVAHYELIDSAHWTNDSICFTVQNDWNLDFVGESAPDWLVLDKKAGYWGNRRVNLTLTPNTDTENGRETQLRLTSGEVSNIISVRQLPAKK